MNQKRKLKKKKKGETKGKQSSLLISFILWNKIRSLQNQKKKKKKGQ
jgi:hypothetical protein